MIKISVSIVLHNTSHDLINNLIDCCSKSISKVDIFLIDNSQTNSLNYLDRDNRVRYLKAQKNGGFGAGHNLAIQNYDILNKYDYHIVINPDIEFGNNVIGDLLDFMKNNRDVGILMPKILNIDGSLQYARRLLPSPFDIFMKRFFPSSIVSSNYEMRTMESKIAVEIPSLCGCFMFLRTSALKSEGLFDENYFMYFEDIDLSRRISKNYSSVYFPNSKVIHFSNNEHRRSVKLFLYSLRSALRYFNKWGYIDSDRVNINSDTVQKIITLNNEFSSRAKI